jgi:hypothetical protein
MTGKQLQVLHNMNAESHQAIIGLKLWLLPLRQGTWRKPHGN